jgi:hypothetical protein
MYQWMNRHLHMGLDDPVVEQDFQPLTDQEMAVWNDQHPAPKETGFAHQRSVCRWLDQQANQALAAAEPTDEKSLAKYREIVGTAWKVIFDQGMPESVDYQLVGREVANDVAIEKGIVTVADRGTTIPLLTVSKAGVQSKGTLIWTDDSGKTAAFNDDGSPRSLLIELIDKGMTVLLPDLYHQGELLVKGIAVNEQPLIDDDRPYSAFTFCYNRTAIVRRTTDLLAVISHALAKKPNEVSLLGTGSAALWVAPASLHTGSLVKRIAIADGSARFADAASYRDVKFVPGAVKYGDLPALLALRAPDQLAVMSDQPAPEIVSKAYRSAGGTSHLQWENVGGGTDTILSWMERK